MDAGMVAALAGTREATLAASKSTRCTSRMWPTPSIPAVIVLLNLSRDQLDRVGEINHIERPLRAGSRVTRRRWSSRTVTTCS